ncbi:hypothetical protein HDU76_008965 [Blyttiomyces sp. JEL0837]|nr:hypothetical protein HDU76_008965 [Blyttiomyces sp. JEL0837]
MGESSAACHRRSTSASTTTTSILASGSKFSGLAAAAGGSSSGSGVKIMSSRRSHHSLVGVGVHYHQHYRQHHHQQVMEHAFGDFLVPSSPSPSLVHLQQQSQYQLQQQQHQHLQQHSVSHSKQTKTATTTTTNTTIINNMTSLSSTDLVNALFILMMLSLQLAREWMVWCLERQRENGKIGHGDNDDERQKLNRDFDRVDVFVRVLFGRGTDEGFSEGGIEGDCDGWVTETPYSWLAPYLQWMKMMRPPCYGGNQSRSVSQPPPAPPQSTSEQQQQIPMFIPPVSNTFTPSHSAIVTTQSNSHLQRRLRTLQTTVRHLRTRLLEEISARNLAERLRHKSQDSCHVWADKVDALNLVIERLEGEIIVGLKGECEGLRRRLVELMMCKAGNGGEGKCETVGGVGLGVNVLGGFDDGGEVGGGWDGKKVVASGGTRRRGRSPPAPIKSAGTNTTPNGKMDSENDRPSSVASSSSTMSVSSMSTSFSPSPALPSPAGSFGSRDGVDGDGNLDCDELQLDGVVTGGISEADRIASEQYFERRRLGKGIDFGVSDDDEIEIAFEKVGEPLQQGDDDGSDFEVEDDDEEDSDDDDQDQQVDDEIEGGIVVAGSVSSITGTSSSSSSSTPKTPDDFVRYASERLLQSLGSGVTPHSLNLVLDDLSAKYEGNEVSCARAVVRALLGFVEKKVGGGVGSAAAFANVAREMFKTYISVLTVQTPTKEARLAVLDEVRRVCCEAQVVSEYLSGAFGMLVYGLFSTDVVFAGDVVGWWKEVSCCEGLAVKREAIEFMERFVGRLEEAGCLDEDEDGCDDDDEEKSCDGDEDEDDVEEEFDDEDVEIVFGDDGNEVGDGEEEVQVLRVKFE